MTRRELLQLTGLAMAPELRAESPADYSLEIAPYQHEVSARKFIKTIAYNGKIPGPLLRMQEGKQVTVEIANNTSDPEVVHWHGLFLPPEVDGAMEEGTPAIAPGQKTRVTFTPNPAGFRWYHTHTFAGRNLKKGQYTGQHGFLYIQPREDAGRYDQEIFLALHDWEGHLMGSDDGSMNPTYDVSTINGRKLGFGEPLRVKPGQRVLFHILNSSATEQHCLALPGHRFQVIALDGNPAPLQRAVSAVCLAPAERVSALVEMNQPGIWVLGETRKEFADAGMGMVVEYGGATGEPRWSAPESPTWDYGWFGNRGSDQPSNPQAADTVEIPMVFKSKFAGHGALEHWTINGKSYPHTDTVALVRGQHYRLLFKNQSTDPHPVHFHRHRFELRRLPGHADLRGILKDTVMVPVNSQVDVEFRADQPGLSLFHCHQQDHMDMGFMMLFRCA